MEQDIKSRSLRVVEFGTILERLASYCAFSASAELAASLTPAADLETASRRLAETTEARGLLDQHPQLGIGGAHDMRPQIQAAQKGAVLQPMELLDLHATLFTARSLRRTIVRLEASFPHLAFLARSLGEFQTLMDAIVETVDDRGEVLDSASAELAHIRRELNIVRSRLMERLQRFLTSRDFAQVIQEPIITERDGRYVIPIRAEARGRVPGIVHDASSSGATLYVEPMGVVDLGNQLRELQVRETREVERLLRELSARIAAQGEPIRDTIAILAELDLTFAKAQYAAALRAVEPKLGLDRSEAPFSLSLIDARHPLLDPERVVPVTVTLGDGYSVLVITGPNTGGKTVTLKTVGLLSAMAQSGMHIPADEGSRLPVFDGVFADIGDEQSIEQSLSTFSSHLSNIVQILQTADEHSLVLLDELGAGTDPVEGAAMARSILQHLLDRKILTLVATHYAELKAFAYATAGVENASMEFDVETLRPTFHLQQGLPGRSNAFAIAGRLGLPPPIIEAARGLMSTSDVEFESMLAEIRRAKEETARERRRAEQAHQQAERAAHEARKKLSEAERTRRDILAESRRQAQAELDAVRAELYALRKEWRKAPLTRDLAERAEADLAAVEGQVESHPLPPKPEPVAPMPDSRQIQIGDRVYVATLRAEGQVMGLADDGADVQLGALRAHLPLDALELRGKAAPVHTTSSVVVPAVESPGTEVHLRGMRAEEALDKLEKYIDRAYLAGLPYIRVVHGKGTGTLRRLVRDLLNHHPLVKSTRNAEPQEGGEGVTVAELASK